ncbi:alpha/beta hydrolase [Staphylococcus saprophyticus]|uniref:Carboxylesterase n=1 Tax=Staphylococcus saprophyticus TaxID=29385 RepID=A0A380HR57_STASA|nr:MULTISPECIES: alpha/beta hydrolase [Staphylococcus]MBF2753463.1 alpha/beta hydrolase [Staphylococcus saprophyticus]MBF2779927.1 alpha/beta hydrolase [Staphylococcus saprophyticus]MBF2782247.1 alpha/beta hydrolase [Staphylococcus saprophyticus]MBN6092585.1 alpha/beta hydrolase [Staphylococcus saprophyticus]MDL1994202.1 alpha/beta hydrolase [Staphylococcus saprophyticus]
MINVKAPNPIFLEHEASEKAILLLHSFTGTVRDVKLLATKLHEAGFTCYVPAYKGHGLMLDELMAFDVDDWLADATAGYQFLKDKGYSEISVCGISLGGILSLKLAESKEISSIAIMSTPYRKSDAGLSGRLEVYGQRMGSLVGLEQADIDQQLAEIENYSPQLYKFQLLVENVMADLKDITAPIAIKYGEQDDDAYETSAHYIYERIQHEDKEMKGYGPSKHLMTYGEGHLEVEQDIIAFFEDY